VTEEKLGGATLHCKTSGVTDHFATDDEHAIAITKRIVANLNYRKQPQGTARYEDIESSIIYDFVVLVTIAPPKEPAFDPKELYGIIPADMKKAVDVRLVPIHGSVV